MKIKLIDFGLKKDHYPFRPHENDAGADEIDQIFRVSQGFRLLHRTVIYSSI